MPSWGEVQRLQEQGQSIDAMRQKVLARLSQYTKRNVISYYSGFLSCDGPDISISDSDTNGFMNAAYGLEKTKGLDLILHTPGGAVSATGAIGQYLRSLFGTDIRCIVPQIAMSAGTMTACIGTEIVMGKHSSIGPIDPQFGGLSCGEVLEEIERAKKEISSNPATIPFWQMILAKYPPAFIGKCEKAVEFAQELVAEWLTTGMFAHEKKGTGKKVAKRLGDHKKTKQHDRHILIKEALALGLKVKPLEEDKVFQDIVLTLHHLYMSTFTQNPKVFKIIENQNGNMIAFKA